MQIRERIAALRAELSARDLDAYVIATADPHQSEYPPDHWRHRAWISGFAGSAGTVVVTGTQAGLWTDSRYFLEAEHAVAGTGIELFRMGEPDVPDYADWLASELERGGTVGCDRSSFSLASFRSLTETLSGSGIALVATDDLVGAINADRQPLPAMPVATHDVRFAGASRGEKISAIRSVMEQSGVQWHVISTLDDIAWLLNIRGSDVPFNPVVVAHCILGHSNAMLFVNETQLDADVRSELERDGVTIEPYERFLERVASLSGTVLLSPTQVSVGTAESLGDEAKLREQLNLTTTAKAVKNATELDHTRQVMVRDGVAMVRFLHWLEGAVASEEVTEMSAAAKLESLRAEGENYRGEAFRTVSGYRGHGPLPHYSVDEESNARIEPAGIYLVDSGAQYLDGTTDITRTVSLDEPSEEERTDFTLVLKGHIGIATIKFPAGTTGSMIDALSREHLWRTRRSFSHGTGHGVGFYLNVHEGPQRIAQSPNPHALVPGMIVSNEPGLYRREQYGIRIENLVVVREEGTSEFGQFLSFETLTLCPFDRSLIEVSLLTDAERAWVDEYHREVREKLHGHLEEPVASWLDAACAPL